MRCPNCHRRVKSGDRVCPHCGRPLVWPADPDPTAADQSGYTIPRMGLLRRRLVELGASVGVGVLAAGLFVYHTSSVSLGYAETYSLGLASQPLPVFWHAHQSNMLLYDVLLSDWMKVTALLGVVPSPLVARLPSIAAMALAAIVVLLVGSRFWSVAMGAVASVLFALNELILQQAQLALGYAVQLLLVCLAWCALLLALNAPATKRWWAVYAGMMILAFYASLLSVFVLAAQVLGVAALLLRPLAKRAEDFPLLYTRGWRAVLGPGAAALSAIVVGVTPLAVDARTHQGGISGVPIATPASLWSFLLAQTAQHAPAALVLLAACMLGVVLGMRARRGLPLLLLLWAVVPVIGWYAVTQPPLDLHDFSPGDLSVAIPALALLAALGVTALRPRWAAVGVTLGVLVLVAQTPGAYYPGAETQPFLETMGWMEQLYQTGDGIICRPDSAWCGIPVSYYLQSLYRGPEHLPAEFPGTYHWDTLRSTPTEGPTLTSYLQKHACVFVITVAPIGGDPATVKDGVPATLAAAGYSLTGTFRPAPSGDVGAIAVDEYVRASATGLHKVP